MKIAVVTGTSSGIGFQTALHLARAGYFVYAGMRNLEKAPPLIEAAKGHTLEVIEMDVTVPSSVTKAFATIYEKGPVSLLVNNAGIGGASPLELTPDEEHRQIFETNYFGMIACIKAVLPSMRQRGQGDIVNISSMIGVLATANQIAYSASKHAVEAASEALAHEVYEFGVRVFCIQPGVVSTNIFENATEATRYDKTSPYKNIMRRNGKLYGAGFKAPASPEQVAETILRALTDSSYKFRWPIGVDSVGICEGRPRISDEDWITMGGALTDSDYNERFKKYFKIQL